MRVAIRTRDGAEVEVTTDYSEPDRIDLDLIGPPLAGVRLDKDLARILGRALLAAADEEGE